MTLQDFETLPEHFPLRVMLLKIHQFRACCAHIDKNAAELREALKPKRKPYRQGAYGNLHEEAVLGRATFEVLDQMNTLFVEIEHAFAAYVSNPDQTMLPNVVDETLPENTSGGAA